MNWDIFGLTSSSLWFLVCDGGFISWYTIRFSLCRVSEQSFGFRWHLLCTFPAGPHVHMCMAAEAPLQT